MRSFNVLKTVNMPGYRAQKQLLNERAWSIKHIDLPPHQSVKGACPAFVGNSLQSKTQVLAPCS
jgi:hypothetical protein